MEKVYDAHVHFSFNIPLKETVEIFKAENAVTGTEKLIFLSLPHHIIKGKFSTDYLQNLKALYLKEEFSPNGYAFAGLIHPENHNDKKVVADMFLNQVKEYFTAGFDGIKMLEGDPNFRKTMGVKLDSEIYDKFYSFCEENTFPITMHVANPDNNWDYDSASIYAIQQGRVYDGTYPTKKELTEEVFGIMQKHPKLRLTLAHCGFFSKHIEQAERFLGDYENTVLDITPGGEQLINMSREWDKWLPFFEKYQDRIIYGTDYYAFPKDENWQVAFNRRPKFVREMLETNGEYVYLDEKFKGVLLSKNLRDKIYRENFVRLYGSPRKTDYNYVVSNCRTLITRYQNYTIEDIKHIYLKDIEYKLGKSEEMESSVDQSIFKMKKSKLQSDINDLKLMENRFSE